VTRYRAVLAAGLALTVAACSGSGPDPAPAPEREEPVVKAVIPPEPDPLPRMFLTVVDGDTGERIAGARVRVGNVVLRTDASGLADHASETIGTRRVHVTAPGYMPRKARIELPGQVPVYRRELQWPVYGANPARTQVHPAIGLKPPFRIVWQRGLKGLLEFPAVVWEGVAYVNNIKGYTQALSMRNGRILWRKRLGTRMATSPGIDPERRLLVVPTMIPGYVSVLDMDTGKRVWRYYTGRSEPSPVIRKGIAYLAATNGNVYALDLRRRKARWIHSTGVKITGSPSLVGNRLYIGDYAGRVFALDARNGRRIWTGSAGTRVYGTVAATGSRVFAPSVFSGLSALSARNGGLLWRIPVGVYLYSSPAVYRGRVYFGTYSGTLYAASARSGRILWRRNLGGRISGAVQVVAGVVYAATTGRTGAWHWRTGKRLWTFPHGDYVPVSGNGGRLLMHGFSRIWAVEPKRRS
jgi:outer membrane protein assembly factor BamB